MILCMAVTSITGTVVASIWPLQSVTEKLAVEFLGASLTTHKTQTDAFYQVVDMPSSR